jgi:threonine aldolase
MVRENINPDDIHFPRTALVAIENTMNKGGGATYDMETIRDLADVCRSNGLKFHLDGARLFNALVESNDDPKSYGELFDTISICFSKGLGAPVGSALLGSHAAIKQAKRVRKVFGGGMRQAGYLAAACSYALDHNVDRLKEDHSRAREIGQICTQLTFVKNVYPVDTNIVIAELDGVSEKWVLDELAQRNIHAVGFGKGLVRFVTHLDFTDDHLETFRSEMIKLKP